MAPLQVSLSHCHTYGRNRGRYDDWLTQYRVGSRRVVDPEVVQTILRAALDAKKKHRFWSRESRAWTTMRFGLVFEYRIDDDPSMTRETLNLVTRAQTLKRSPRLPIDRLSIHLVPPDGPRRSGPHARHRKALVTRGRALGQLLRSLLLAPAVAVETVALLNGSYSDYRLVGAALSAVALASPPVSALRCSGLLDPSRPRDELLRLAWLAFALHCRPHRRVPLALALQATDTLVHPQASEYIQRLVARGTPLRDVVGDMLRLRFGGDDDQVAQLSVACLRLGSSVRLTRDTRLFAEPIRDTDEFMFVALEAEEEGVEVDAVAHVADYGGWVGVVYAGYGLVRTPTANVIAWHRLDEDDDVVMSDAEDEAPTMALSSLALGFGAITHLPPLWRDPVVHRVPWILPLLPGSATLRTLTIDRAVVTRYDLETLLASFPHLQTLQLDRCVVETLAPLVDAFRRTTRPGRITVLSLHGVRDLTQRDLVLRYSPVLNQNLKPDPQAASNDHAAAWLVPLVDALALGVLPGLQELVVDVIGVRDSDAWPVVTRLVSVLSNPSSGHALTRLHVACHRRLMPACGELLEPLRGAVLHDPPRVRRAVLSVLQARGCGGAHEIVRNVLAMAEGSLVRTVTWAWK